MKTRPLTVSEAGRIGGMTTFEKYGQEFMSQIAKRGARLKKRARKTNNRSK
jgi:hypothetical protein